MLRHLPVSKRHCRVRNKFLHMICNFRNITYPVIYIIHLSVPIQFSLNSFTDHLIIVLHHICLDRHPIHRRLFQHAHIADSNQTHMQRPRDRRGSQRQYIHIFPQFFNLLFVCHAKSLLFIYDQKSQILKFHIL